MDRIIVTERDIFEGRTKSSAECPVALALQRHFNAVGVAVAQSGITVQETLTRAVSYVTPAPVRTFISDFDFTAAGTPFEFELDAPTSILELNQSNEWMQRKEPTWIA